MHDELSAFRDAATAYGLIIDSMPIADGNIHRVQTREDKDSQKSGWYVLNVTTHGSYAGAFGDWRHSDNKGHKWSSRISNIDPANMEELRRLQFEQERAREKARAEAAERAISEIESIKKTAKIYQSGESTQDLPYLWNKGFRECPSEVWLRGNTLYLPVYDADWRIVNLQSIYPTETNGFQKRWIAGARRKGCWMAVPGNEQWGTGPIAIAEGYATAATMAQASGIWTLAVGGTSALEEAAQALRNRYPRSEIIVVADDDHNTPGNPGLTKATMVAQKINATLIQPLFDGVRDRGDTDLNDQHIKHGIESVRVLVEQSRARHQSKVAAKVDAKKAFEDALNPRALWEAGTDPVFPEREVLILRDQGNQGHSIHAPEAVPLMHLGITAMLSGVGGGGKTHLAARLAVCVAAGGEWLREHEPIDPDPTANKAPYGWFVDAKSTGGVLWIGAEESETEMGRRLWKACRMNADGTEASPYEQARRRDLVANRIRVVALQDTPAEGERLVKAVTKRDKDTGESWTDIKRMRLWEIAKATLSEPAPDGSPWRLIILDPMIELVASGAENDSDAMAEALRHGIHALRQGTNATLLVLHHNRKGSAADGDVADAARGSSAIMGSMRWAAAISKNRDGFVDVQVTKSNYTRKGEPVTLTWPENGDAWLMPVTRQMRQQAAEVEARKLAEKEAKKQATKTSAASSSNTQTTKKNNAPSKSGAAQSLGPDEDNF